MALSKEEQAAILADLQKAVEPQILRAAQSAEQTGLQIAEKLKQQEAEIAKQGKSSEETAAEIAKLHLRYKGDIEGIKEAQTKEADKIAALEESTNAALARFGAPHQGGGREPKKSLGRAFVESDAFKGWSARGSLSKSDSLTVPGGLDALGGYGPGVSAHSLSGELRSKASLRSDAVERFARELRVDMIDVPRPALQIRDLLRVVPYPGGSIRVVRQLGFHDGAEVAPTSITWLAGVLTITRTAHGLRLGELFSIQDADPVAYDGYYVVDQVPTADTFTARLAADPVTSPATAPGTYTRLRRFGAAGTVLEEGTLPTAVYTPEVVNRNEALIGHMIPITLQARANVDGLAAMIDSELVWGVGFAEEAQILFGSGTDPDLHGIFNEPRLPRWVWSGGALTPVPDTKLDAIRRSVTISRLAHLPPSGVVLAPEDSEDVDLTKGTDGHYIYIRDVAVGGANRIFALPRVETAAMPPGRALVGAFGLGATLYVAEEADIMITDSNREWFEKNILAIKAQERAVLAVTRPEAFVEVLFDSAPVAAT